MENQNVEEKLSEIKNDEVVDLKNDIEESAEHIKHSVENVQTEDVSETETTSQIDLNKNKQKNNKKIDNTIITRKKELTTSNKRDNRKNWEKPTDSSEEPVTTNQNTILGAKIKLASEASYVREILDNNPSFNIKPKDVNLMFAIKDLPPEMRKGVNLMSYKPDWSKDDPFEGIPYEEALKLKRDYYSVTGNYGDFLPDETSLFMYRSPVDTVNLALDQVAMLIEKGFEVRNKRTGDLVTKKNYKLYIKLWSKDKDLILVTARQRRGKED